MYTTDIAILKKSDGSVIFAGNYKSAVEILSNLHENALAQFDVKHVTGGNVSMDASEWLNSQTEKKDEDMTKSTECRLFSKSKSLYESPYAIGRLEILKVLEEMGIEQWDRFFVEIKTPDGKIIKMNPQDFWSRYSDRDEKNTEETFVVRDKTTNDMVFGGNADELLRYFHGINYREWPQFIVVPVDAEDLSWNAAMWMVSKDPVGNGPVERFWVNMEPQLKAMIGEKIYFSGHCEEMRKYLYSIPSYVRNKIRIHEDNLDVVSADEWLRKSKDEGMIKALGEYKEALDDEINHPSHYTQYKGIEVIQLTEQMNFNRGNAVKYIARAGFKGGKEQEVKDLRKAAWYIQREIQRITQEGENAS